MTPVPVERARPTVSVDPLLQLLVGFQKSQVLMTAQHMGVFAELASRDLSGAELCGALSLPSRSGERLLEACASLGLLEIRDGKFANGPLVRQYLTPGGSMDLSGLVDYYRETIYPSCARLAQAVREDRPQVMPATEEGDVFSAMEKNRALTQGFTGAMHSMGLLEGQRLAQLYPFENVSAILDMGGGSGALSMALAQVYPHLKISLFDRPAVCELANQYIQTASLDKQIRLMPGDFWKDPWPRDHDAILFSMILHDWSAEENGRLLRQAFEALPSGGRVMIYEQLLAEDRCGPAMTCLTNLTMLLRTTQGSESTVSDYSQLLLQAGFDRIDVYRSSGLRHLLRARKP